MAAEDSPGDRIVRSHSLTSIPSTVVPQAPVLRRVASENDPDRMRSDDLQHRRKLVLKPIGLSSSEPGRPVPLSRGNSVEPGDEKQAARPGNEANAIEINQPSSSSSSAPLPEVLPDSSDVLIRLPSHTVPLAPAIERSPFENFMTMLRVMGFAYEEAEVALVYTKCRSVEEAVDFIERNPDAILHSFRPCAALASPGRSNRRQASPAAAVDNPPALVRQNSALMEELLAAQGSDNTVTCAVCGLARVFHLIDEQHQLIENSQADLRGGPVAAAVAVVAAPADIVVHIDPEAAAHQLEEDHRLAIEIERLDREEEERERAERERRNSAARAVMVNRPNRGLQQQQQQRPGELSAAVRRRLEEAEAEAARRRAEVAAAGVETQPCGICFDDVPVAQFRSGPCGHGFCEECLRGHYRVKIRDAELAALMCPEPSCQRKIPDEEVLRLMQDEAEFVSKFRKFKRSIEVARNPNARWCIKPGCDNFMVGSRDNPKLVCPECQTSVCFECSQAWHQGKRCDEVVDEQYAEWARGRDIQQCPQCRARIEKDLGCNHMTCQSCRHQFCWLCRMPYYDGHFSALNPFGCPGAQFAFEENDTCKPGPITMCFWRLLVLIFIIAGVAIGVALGAVGIGLALGLSIPAAICMGLVNLATCNRFELSPCECLNGVVDVILRILCCCCYDEDDDNCCEGVRDMCRGMCECLFFLLSPIRLCCEATAECFSNCRQRCCRRDDEDDGRHDHIEPNQRVARDMGVIIHYPIPMQAPGRRALYDPAFE